MRAVIATMMVSLAGATACGAFGADALKQASTGFVGCSASEIQITNDEAGFNQRSWDATCQGHVYHCSGVDKASMSCKEDSATPVTRVAEPAAKAKAATSSRAASATSSHAWHRFVERSCGLSVLLPAAPKETERSARVRTGSIVTHVADVVLDDGQIAITCATLPGKGTFDAEKAMDAARDRALEDAGATFESEEDVTMDVLEGRDVRFSVGTERGRIRMLVRDRQLITLTMTPVTAFTSPEIRAFFESVTVADDSAVSARTKL